MLLYTTLGHVFVFIYNSVFSDTGTKLFVGVPMQRPKEGGGGGLIRKRDINISLYILYSLHRYMRRVNK